MDNKEKTIINTIIQKTTPSSNTLPTKKDFNEMLNKLDNDYFLRKEYTKLSFFILTQDFFVDLVQYLKENKIKEVHDLGCGSGLFTYWLREYLKKEGLQEQIKVNAVDYRADGFKNKWEGDFIDDIIINDAVSYVTSLESGETDKHFYIMSWPNYQSNLAFDIIDGIDINESYLYIGEEIGGCTADDNFFNAQKEISVATKDFNGALSFSGIYDTPSINTKTKHLTMEQRESLVKYGEILNKNQIRIKNLFDEEIDMYLAKIDIGLKTEKDHSALESLQLFKKFIKYIENIGRWDLEKIVENKSAKKIDFKWENKDKVFKIQDFETLIDKVGYIKIGVGKYEEVLPSTTVGNSSTKSKSRGI